MTFFACSSDSPDSPDVHGATDIDSQLYVGVTKNGGELRWYLFDPDIH
ncbi:MAG: hypothetical protein FWC15_07350 [Fibromonadales bacterium]|nr:hypothetical protein [Fibromonadales bacterium]